MALQVSRSCRARYGQAQALMLVEQLPLRPEYLASPFEHEPGLFALAVDHRNSDGPVGVSERLAQAVEPFHQLPQRDVIGEHDVLMASFRINEVWYLRIERVEQVVQIDVGLASPPVHGCAWWLPGRLAPTRG